MIEGDKVLICGLTNECISSVLEWVNQPELKKYTGTLYPVSEFEHEEWIKGKAKSKTEKLFLIRDKETEQGIGTIGLRNIDFINSNAEMYISIGNQNFRGGGMVVTL